MCKYIKIIIPFIMCGLLTGCGERAGDSNQEALSSEESLVLDEISEDSDIPASITYQSTGTRGSLNIDANVILPQNINDCPIYALEKVYFEDEDIKLYADKIFDEGSYFLYMPYTKEQIAFLRTKITDLYSNAVDEEEEKAFSCVLLGIDNCEEELSTVHIAEEDLVNVENGELKFYDIRPEVGYPQGECYVLGTIDGKYAMLSFNREDEATRMKIEFISAKSSELVDVGDEYYDVYAIGNKCSYTLQEAEELAREYIDALGFENMQIMRTSNTMSGYSDGSNASEILYMPSDDPVPVIYSTGYEVNGYNVFFGRSYGGYASTYDSNETCHFLHEKEYIRIYVSDYGVTTVEIANPMQEKELISENVTLLDFEAVHQNALAVFEEYIENYKDLWNINEITLGYSLYEEEGEYVLIPTWTYLEHYEDERFLSYSTVVIINALDGTTIWRADGK